MSERFFRYLEINSDTLERLLVALALIVVWGVVAHDFVGYIEAAPAFHIDDNLVNISFNHAATGEHGFPFLTIYYNYMNDRSLLALEGYSLHGPWYYLVGAVFKFLFGDSLVLQRAIHPLGWVAVSALGWFAFRRCGMLPTLLVLGGVAYVFVFNNWPMIRPDIMIPVLGFAAITLATLASQHSRAPWLWGCAMLVGASAFFSHIIAWAIPVLVFASWILVRFVLVAAEDRWGPRRRDKWFELVAMGVGGILAVIAFVIALDASLEDQLHVWLVVLKKALTQQGYNMQEVRSYWEYLLLHLSFTVPSTFVERVVFYGAYVVAIGLVAVSVFRRPACRGCIALLVPPLIVGGGFQLSVGFFPNVHSGYALFPQGVPMWLLAASAAAVLHMLSIRSERLRLVGDWSGSAVVAVLLFLIVVRIADYGSPWNHSVSRYVSFTDYLEKVTAPLRTGTRAWGSSLLSGVPRERIDSVHLSRGASLYFSLEEAYRKELVPDAIIFAAEENRFFLQRFSGSYEPCHAPQCPARSPLEAFFRGVAEDETTEYVPVGLVSASPYGTSTVYVRMPLGGEQNLPSVMINENGDPRWISNLGQSQDVEIDIGGPVSVSFPDGGSKDGVISTSLKTSLPPGRYLVKLQLDPRASDETYIGMATSSRQVLFDRMHTNYDAPVLGVSFAIFPAGSKTAYLVLEHDGGDVWYVVSDGIGFSVEEIRRIIDSPPLQYIQNRPDIIVPKLGDWTLANPVAERTVLDDGRVRLKSNLTKYEYQLMSPKIEVSAGATYTVEIPVDVRSGAISMGVLNEDRSRFLGNARPGETLRFRTAGDEGVYLLISNNYTELPTEPGIAVVGPVTMSRVDGAVGYAERLARCYIEMQHGSVTHCSEDRKNGTGMFKGIRSTAPIEKRSQD